MKQKINIGFICLLLFSFFIIISGCGGNDTVVTTQMNISDKSKVPPVATVIAITGPQINNLNPTSDGAGTVATITGIKFGTTRGLSTVTFNGTAVTSYIYWSDKQIQCFVPPGSTTGNVVITVNSNNSNGVMFTIMNYGHLVLITGGTFNMGGTVEAYEQPVHTVTVNSYYIGKYELTNGEFVVFLNDVRGSTDQTTLDSWFSVDASDWCGITGDKTSGYAVKTSPSDYTKRPVVYVSWYGAVAYCNWLSDKAGLDRCYDGSYNLNITKKGYRLPTEAEWEYGCRGGSTTEYYWSEGYPPVEGSGSQIDLNIWYSPNSGSNHHLIGQKLANSYGLYDMCGNVWEWCYDWDSSPWANNNLSPGNTYYYNQTTVNGNNPTGPSTGVGRIFRGGSWYCTAQLCRSARRYADLPTYRISDIGFRPVRTP